ncbi:MAG: response regulator [Anaerolineales bacterium]
MAGQILAVDDDVINLKLVSATLGKEGYQVITASNGKDGVRLAEELLPDLVILDVMMPEMDGYQACSAIRHNPKTMNLPVMMLTSLSSVEEKIKGFDAGADDYLAKPFSPEELVAHVKVLLRRSVRPLVEEGKKVSAKIISVFSLRGGSGVSTLATNLGCALSSIWNEPTVLVDLVLTGGHSALLMNLPLRHTWADINHINNEDLEPSIVRQILLQHPSGVHVLATSPHPEQNEYLKGEKVKTVLEILSELFSYVIVDLPHDFSDTTLAGLDAAHEILLLMTPEMAAVRSAVSALETFENLNYPKEIVKIVLNWTFPKNGLPRKGIESALNKPVDIQIPYTADALVQAINLGAPITLTEPQSPLGALYEDIAFLLSKDSHKKVKPATPTEAWQRVVKRIQQRQSKKNN